MVLEALAGIMFSPTHFTKFSSALPLTRILVLLLGDRPTSIISTQILHIIGLALKTSASFIRKFELISGWTVLRGVLPASWDQRVQNASFDVLLGRVGVSGVHESNRVPTVSCPNIITVILGALQHGLNTVSSECLEHEATGKFV